MFDGVQLADDKTDSLYKSYLFRAIIAMFIAVAGYKVRDFGTYINLQGALISTTIYYVLPCLFYLKTKGNCITKRQKILVWSIITFGILGGFLSGYETGLSLIGTPTSEAG